MLQSKKPITEEEKKEQEKIDFQIRLAKSNAKPITIKTDKQMESIRFRIFNKKEVMPVLSMSTR